METPKRIIDRYHTLKGSIETYCSFVDEICRYFAPELSSLMKTSDGSEIVQPVTSTGIVATNTLISGLFSNTLQLSHGNIKDRNRILQDNPEVEQWYKKLSQSTAHSIGGSDFPQKYRAFLAGYVPKGTGIMYVGYDNLYNKPIFRPYNVCDCAWEFDLDGNVIEFHREYKATAEQLVEEFGMECLPSKILTAYSKGDKQSFRMLHSMVKRKVGQWEENTLDPIKMKYADMHINMDESICIKSGGSTTMRYLVSRFYHMDGESTGRSPAMQAYQSIRTLSRTTADLYDSIEFAAGPPLFLPDRDAVENSVIEPFAVNYFNPAKGSPYSLPVNTTGIQSLAGIIQTCTDEINKLFFVDIFMALEQAKGNKTAYEVSQLVAERVQALAPVANSLSKFFADLYTIVAKDIIHNHAIEESPVKSPDPIVTYTSRLDVRLSEVETDALLAASTRVAQFDQMVQQSDLLRSKTDPLEATNAIFNSFNVPTEAIVDDAKAKRNLADITEAKAQAAQAQAKSQVIKPIDTQKAPELGSLMSVKSQDGIF